MNERSSLGGRFPRPEPPAAAAPAASHATAAIELAYGLLWRCGCDRRSGDGERIYQARQALLAQLDQGGQDRGIDAAQALMRDARPDRTTPRRKHSAR